ncbi:MAG: HFLK protein [Clostridiales bacterium]|nr:HFLK protein [Clostridiales bacterium]
MPDDYGYFGKGITGYAHYMLANEDNNKQSKKPSGGGKGGCLTLLVLLTLGAALLPLILL